MSIPRFLAAGAIVSLVLHGTGSAFFAKDPDDVSIAASEGGGVSVIGSIEDLVAGVRVEVVSETKAVEDIDPDVEPADPVNKPVKVAEVTPDEPVKPVEITPLQPAADPPPVEMKTQASAVPVVEGVTLTDRVTAAQPVETVAPEAAPLAERVSGAAEPVRSAGSVKPIETAAPVNSVEPAKPVAPQSEPKPVEIAKVDPSVTSKPVLQALEVQQPIEDSLLDVTQTPRTKPTPPVRKTQPRKTPEKKVKTAQKKGAEASSRKGGERVTSNTARSNANGHQNARSNDGGTRATSNYKGRVVAKLRRAKRYPRDARRKNLQGTVRVSFTISRNGSVSGIRISRSSGHPVLDQAALDMVRRASPMPKFPGDITVARMSLQVPIRFSR